MTVKEQIQYWVSLSENDIPVAESLFEKKHYVWCLFIGHLILEKIIKALYVQDNLKMPPKTHDLVKLIESTKIEINKGQKDFLDMVNDFNLESRYPDEKASIIKMCDEAFTKTQFNRIKEIHKWIKSRLKY